MDGWVDGWVDVKAGLRIAYSNLETVHTGLVLINSRQNAQNFQLLILQRNANTQNF